MILKRGFLIFFILLAAVGILFCVASNNRAALETATNSITRPTVIIDAGHGGLTNTID